MASSVPGAGLCASCRHARVIEGRREARYLLCERHSSDGRFAKYPALPVRSCPGHQARG